MDAKLKGNKVIEYTDLDAELSECEKCSKLSVLMFNWCKKCRLNNPTEFKELNPILD